MRPLPVDFPEFHQILPMYLIERFFPVIILQPRYNPVGSYAAGKIFMNRGFSVKVYIHNVFVFVF